MRRLCIRHVLEALLEASLIALLAAGAIAGSAVAAKPTDAGSKAHAADAQGTTTKTTVEKKTVSSSTETTTTSKPIQDASGRGGSKGGGGKTGGSCVRNAPGISVDNTWSWSGWGSYGLPGQQLTYALNVINYDVGCASSSFVVTVSAPDGFLVSIPTDTVSLKSSTSAYLWGYVTSPGSAADGDYPLTVSVVRQGTSGPAGSFGTAYKVYSSDNEAPTLFWPNPADGTTVSGRSYTVIVSARDDHAVKTVDLFIDGTALGSTACDDISDTCQSSATWSPVTGQHTATFRAEDWLGNVSWLTVTFTV